MKSGRTAVSETSRLRGARVLFVLPSLGMGGAERQAFLLARHLARDEGAAVRVIGFTRRGGIADLFHENGIPADTFHLYHNGEGRTAQVVDFFRFLLFLRRHRVEILLPYCMFPNVLCATAWRLGGARVCTWNQRDEGRARLEPWLERLAVRSVRCFVSNSLHGADFLKRTLRVPPERVHVIHNGVELPEPVPSREVWRTRLQLPRNAFVSCMVANLHGYKDHATLVTAWRQVVDRLAQQRVPAHLLLAGRSGDRYEAIVQQIHDLGLDADVHLLGEVSDMSGLLGAVDLAVFSSYAEGVPNAVLEALAAGVAVVGTDYPGIREAVGPSGFELLAQPRDPDDLAKRIVLMALDPMRRAAAGRAGQAWVGNEFGLARMCEESVRQILAELGGR